MNLTSYTRRDFLKTVVAGSTAAATFALQTHAAPAASNPSPAKLPRWRGFNLVEKLTAEPGGNPPFYEHDFQHIQAWGFDFARLPLSYHCWAKGDPTEWLNLDESKLKDIDAAVDMGRRHGVHINLNLHRAPGYCVNPPAEPLDLFKDTQALDACVFHWAHFAKRYRGIPSSQLSFDLINEPGNIPEPSYAKVVKALVSAIRTEDPDRLILADGLKWGRDPVPDFADLKIAQSTRGYDPMPLTHYKASWAKGNERWKDPHWPLSGEASDHWDKERLRREKIEPWKAIEKRGVGVHVGEWGAFNKTPHDVVLRWMKDNLDLWREAGWGWALWNLRGAFGVINSNRSDVTYEEFEGRKLDRAMLEVLQAG